jgi:hypothetical protein
VGGVFVLLGAWWTLRGRFASVAPYTAGLGILLMVLGAIAPRALYWPNRGWMALAEALSFVSTRIVLAVVFFIVMTPIGVVKRLTGWDPLRRRMAPAPSYWRAYSERQRDSRHYEKMY